MSVAVDGCAEELRSIMQRFDSELSALGEKVRREIVAPACRKHKLVFMSGNGTFFFKKRGSSGSDNTYGSREDLDDEVGFFVREPKNRLTEPAKATLGPILDLLNEEPTRGQCLGYFVSDVD